MTRRSSERISSGRKLPNTKKHILKQITSAKDSIGAGLQECSLSMTKQSEAVKTYLIGHDPDKEQKRHPTMGRLDEGI